MKFDDLFDATIKALKPKLSCYANQHEAARVSLESSMVCQDCGNLFGLVKSQKERKEWVHDVN